MRSRSRDRLSIAQPCSQAQPVTLYDSKLHGQLINACQGVPECEMALHRAAPTFDGVVADLRGVIGFKIRCQQRALPQQYLTGENYRENHHENHHESNEQYWVDRRNQQQIRPWSPLSQTIGSRYDSKDG